MTQRMDERMATVLHYPAWSDEEGPEKSASTSDVQTERKLSLAVRFLLWLGFAMANAENPRGWQWNPATIISCLTFMLVILGMVAGASWFLSRLNSQQETIIQRLDTIEKKADNAVAVAMADKGVEPSPTPKEHK